MVNIWENCKMRWKEVWNDRKNRMKGQARNYSYVRKSEKEGKNWKN